ncbi:MAG: hypothetical protein LBP76_13105 [Treponema sp.]|jgi:hypothetical protein|nr:hypothetical protein [Treponema sp.]
MSAHKSNGLTGFAGIFTKKQNRRFLYLVFLGVFAWRQYQNITLVRRTFVFYTALQNNTVVEDRMHPHAETPEDDIKFYIEEALLGPVSPDLAPLFPRETRLCSFMYRDGDVYADLSESAALPEGNGDVMRSLFTLYAGIKRNFPSTGAVKLFIMGNKVLLDDIHGYDDDFILSGLFGKQEPVSPPAR